MSFGRKNLRLKFTRKGYAIPVYLTPDRDTAIIQLAVDYISAYAGRPLYEVNIEELKMLLADERLGEGLLHVLLTYFYKPKIQIEAKDVRKLRIKVFELVNKLYKGFVPSEKREEFLQILREKFGIEDESILWSDEPCERIIPQRPKPNPLEVIAVYNYEVLDTIAVHSFELKIKIPLHENISQSLTHVAELTKLCKIYGLIPDLTVKNNLLTLRIQGPLSLYERATKYGERLSYYLTISQSLLDKISSEWSAWFKLRTRKGSIDVLALSSYMKPVMKCPKDYKTLISSMALRELTRKISQLNIEASTCVTPIIVGGRIYIPDIEVKVDHMKIPVEVVPYWREKYVKARLSSIFRIISKMESKPILIVDSRYKRKVNYRYVVHCKINHSRVEVDYKELMAVLDKIRREGR